jgi:hypothetical protein
MGCLSFYRIPVAGPKTLYARREAGKSEDRRVTAERLERPGTGASRASAVETAALERLL